MSKSVRCIALSLIFFLPGMVGAEVRIAPACRIKNRPPGRCGWCCLETLARHHKVQVLYGVTEHHSSRCGISSLETVLEAANVSFRIQYPGKQDKAILRYAIGEGLGAVIGFRELYSGAGGHIVTLVDFTDEGVKVIDPNDADGRIRKMSMERFLYWWDGFALVLDVEPAAE